MLRLAFARNLAVSVALLTAAATANAVTLRVNCGQHSGMSSIGAAIRAVQSSESRGPSTILVSGNCRENVVIQSIDRLTLTAIKGASITDASGGKLSVVDMEDSRDVAINGFVINAGADGVTGTSGVVCGDSSVCRLSGNTIQGATDGSGFAVFGSSTAVIDGDILQGNATGLGIFSASSVRGTFTARKNSEGARVVRSSYLNIADCNVSNNAGVGITVRGNATLNLGNCSISGNGSNGIMLQWGAYGQLATSTITGNGNVGVDISDLSFAIFDTDVITGNQSGTDVVCNPQYSATRGALDSIGGGTTNCVEP